MTMPTCAIHIFPGISVLSIKVETHSSIKLSKKNFGGILRLKSVRRILVIGLIYGPRASKSSGLC